jgi:hypothetical protein
MKNKRHIQCKKVFTKNVPDLGYAIIHLGSVSGIPDPRGTKASDPESESATL